MKVTLAALSTLLLLEGTAVGWRGEVQRVYDGDYISARYGRGHANIHLQGVQAPERGQPYSKQSRELTRKLVRGQTVSVLPSGSSDRQGRIIARVFVGQRCLNEELVKAGLAWWDRNSAPGNKKLARLEAQARKARRGLWADPGPMPPWDWREGKRTPAAKPRRSCKSHAPCAGDRVCRRANDCVLVRKRLCGCPPCYAREAWAMTRSAARRWQHKRRQTRCPAVRCARCPRKSIRAACVKGRCAAQRPGQGSPLQAQP